MNKECTEERLAFRQPDGNVAIAEQTMSSEAAEALTALCSSRTIVAECPRDVNNCHITMDPDEEDEEGFEIPQRFTKSGRKRAVSFPMKLMKVLSNRNFAHIITWMPSGKSFSILKPKLFATEILPDHFKSAKYSSFTRKMHRWGFMRHYRGDESGAFYHKEFQKDRFDMVEKMTCQKVPEPLKTITNASPVEATTPRKDSPMANPPPAGSASPSSSGVANNGSIKSMLTLQDQKQTLADPMAHQLHRPMARRPLSMPTQLMAPQSMARTHPASVRALGMPNPVSLQQRLVSEMPSTTSESIVAAKLNAAIEMEVSRRLQERIKAAAVQMSRVSAAGLGGLLQQSSAQLALTDNASALRAKLMQMQQQKEQLQYLAMTGTLPLPAQGLGMLPETNIQGAKTA